MLVTNFTATNSTATAPIVSPIILVMGLYLHFFKFATEEIFHQVGLKKVDQLHSKNLFIDTYCGFFAIFATLLIITFRNGIIETLVIFLSLGLLLAVNDLKRPALVLIFIQLLPLLFLRYQALSPLPLFSGIFATVITVLFFLKRQKRPQALRFFIFSEANLIILVRNLALRIFLIWFYLLIIRLFTGISLL